jgi:hypothetical protein
LTDFGGVSIPTSAAEFLEEFTSIKFATFTLDDLSDILGNFDPMANPQVFFLLMFITIIDFFMIVCNKFRHHRRVVRRGRAAVQRRKEAKEAAAQKLTADDQYGGRSGSDVLAQRRARKAKKAGEKQLAEQKEKEKEKRKFGKQPAIQDRVFLDLLDADMYTCTADGKRPTRSTAAKYEAPTPSDTASQVPKGTATLHGKDDVAPSSPLARENALLASLLGPGNEVSTDAISPPPWAEVLQQRIRSGGGLGTVSPSPTSTQCRMIQQRLPSRAMLREQQGSSGRLTPCETPPGHATGALVTTDPPRRRPDFRQQRIPNCSARLSGANQSSPRTPIRLDALARRTPSSVATAPPADRPRQERIPNLSRPSSLTGSQSVVCLSAASRLQRLPSTPTIASDGTVSTRLTMRRSSSQALVFGRQESQALPGALSLAERAPNDPTTPAAVDVQPVALSRTLRRESMHGSQPASLPPSPPRTPVVPPEESQASCQDKDLANLLDSVTNALGSEGDHGNAQGGSSRLSAPMMSTSRLRILAPLPSAPRAQSSRIMLQGQGESQPDASAAAAAAAPRLQSARLRRLPLPPAATNITPVSSQQGIPPEAGLEGDFAGSTKNSATAPVMSVMDESASEEQPSAPITSAAVSASSVHQSSRLRLMHTPAGPPPPKLDSNTTGDASACGSSGAPSTFKSMLVEVTKSSNDTRLAEWKKPEVSGVLSTACRPGASFATLVKRTQEKTDNGEKSGRAQRADRFGNQFANSIRVSSSLKSIPFNKVAAFGAAGRALKLAGNMAGAERMSSTLSSTRGSLGELRNELREAFSSRKAFKKFVYKATNKGVKRVKKFAYDYWTTARSEHTIANAIAPPEEDILGDNLTDEQIIHIFWTTVLGELCMINLLWMNEGDGFDIMNIIILGFMTSIALTVLSIIMKRVFKFCNRKRRRQSTFDRFRRRLDRLLRGRSVRRRARVMKLDGKSNRRTWVACLLMYLKFWKWGTYLKQRQRRLRYEERQTFLNTLEATFAPGRVRRMRELAEKEAHQALKIQSLARRRAARKELVRRRKEQGYDAAAEKVQATAPRRKARAELMRRRREGGHDAAAEKVQASVRRHMAAAEMRKRRTEQKERDVAANKVQSVTRGHSARHLGRAQSTSIDTPTGPSPPPSPPVLGTGSLSNASAGEHRPAVALQLPRNNRFLQRLAASVPSTNTDEDESLSHNSACTSAPPQTLLARPHSQNSTVATIPVCASLASPLVTSLSGASAASTPCGGNHNQLPSSLNNKRPSLLPPLPAPARAAGGGAAAATQDSGAGLALGTRSPFLRRLAESAGKAPDTTPTSGKGLTRLNAQQGLWNRAKGVKMVGRAKISKEDAERIRRSKLVPFGKTYIKIRWYLGWFINLTIFLALWLLNYIYGALHGPQKFLVVMVAWAAALFQTFIIVEPTEVLGIVLLPGLAEHPCVAKCRANLKEYGFI